ncbi:MAG: methyltransferase domain-containing protein [Planctomycetota bacterium]|jgi:SAM-dependent methyltransferase
MTQEASADPDPNAPAEGTRVYDPKAFDEAYKKVVLGNHFFELPSYYIENRPRYEKTMRHIVDIPTPRPAQIFEVGGGQMLLLCKELYGDGGMLGDIGDEYADAVTKYGIDFVECDLLHTELDIRGRFDLIVFCEVFEHMPKPPHYVLEKMKAWMKPGGYMLLTTPNLYRLRNLIRMALGREIFCNFYYPDPGSPMGHPLEYSTDAVRWQLETAGFEVEYIRLEQLVNVGSSLKAKILRKLCAPLLAMRPLWRDNIVALARKPLED